MASESNFYNPNQFSSINFLMGDSADELISQIKQITQPIKIISMYAQGNKHYCWFVGNVKIKRKVKEN